MSCLRSPQVFGGCKHGGAGLERCGQERPRVIGVDGVVMVSVLSSVGAVLTSVS